MDGYIACVKRDLESNMDKTIAAYMNWSGGKDCSMALYRILKNPGYQVGTLLTSLNSVHDRVSMHGLRRSLLKRQADAIGLPLQTIELPEQSNMEEYDQLMFAKVSELKTHGYTHALFGDIFLEDLRMYREQQLKKAGMHCVFPLWQQDTTALLREFIELKFSAIVICVNEKLLDKSFCGRLIDESFLNDLPPNVDPCGENGEYHSFVFDGPIFKHKVECIKGEIVRRTYPAPKASTDEKATEYGFYFCDLI